MILLFESWYLGRNRRSKSPRYADEFDPRNNNISSSPLLRQTASKPSLDSISPIFFESSRKTYSRSLQYDESTIYRSSQATFSRSHKIGNILFDRHSDVHLKDQMLCHYCDWYPINYLSTVIDQYLHAVIYLDWSGVDLRSNPLHPPKKQFNSRSATELQ